MARRPQNLFEVLGQAGQAGLGQIGAQFAAGQRQERQNELQSFFAIMKQQEFEQESAQRASNITLLRTKILQANQNLRRSQMTPEMLAAEQARARDEQLTALGAATVPIPFQRLPVGERIESLDLPPGTELSLPGGIDFTQSDPLAAQQAQAQLEATRALTTQRRAAAQKGPDGKTLSASDQFIFDFLKKTRPADAEEAFFKFLTEPKVSTPESQAFSLFRSVIGGIFVDIKNPEDVEAVAKAVESVTGYNVLTGKSKKQPLLKRIGKRFGEGIGFGRQ